MRKNRRISTIKEELFSWWYDPTGKQYTAKSFRQRMEDINKDLRDPKKKIVKQETVYGFLWISTVWLGIDYGFNFDENPDYRPLIYETMVFKRNPFTGQIEFLNVEAERYSTREEAEIGHRLMVRRYRNPINALRVYLR